MSKQNNSIEQCTDHGVDISAESMKCKPSINFQKTIKYDPDTKKVFDELGNFLGYGTYNEKNKTIIIEHKT